MGYTHSYLKLNFQEIRLSKSIIINLLALIFFVYLKFVFYTNKWKLYNTNIPKKFWDNKKPFIWVHWHGQSLMLPNQWNYTKQNLFALVSRHGDGNFIASLLLKYKIQLIRGAGNPKKLGIKEKGGAMALRSMIKTLKSGSSVALTADQPPGPGKICGMGVISLAKMSGASIIPVAAATSNRYEFNNWDNFTLNFPFGKGSIVWGNPIEINSDATALEMEEKRLLLEDRLKSISRESRNNIDY